MRHARRRRSGFTILEVIMAMSVMALGLATSLTVMQRAFNSIDSARNLTIAAQIMQSEIERMRLKDWTTINAYAAGPVTLTIDPSFTANAAVANRFAFFRSSANVIVGELRSITFTVRWQGIDGVFRFRSFVTYYGRNGLYDYFYNQV